MGGGGEYTMNYEIAGYWEFNFPNFACSESSAVTHSSKCSELGLNQLGDATFTYDQLDPIRPSVMRLTDQAGGSQTSAVWYNTKVQVENGFETSFSFKMSSHCTAIPGEITTGCGAGDGLAFVIQGSDTPNHIGCGGGAMGFADSFDPAEAGCSGISQAFAVEFDTWHNPELRDVNVRGSGTVEINATAVPRYDYVHAAFFSGGKDKISNNHGTQIAGTPAIPTINDGAWHLARVVYIPGTSASAPGRMFLYIDDMQSFVLTAPVRLTRDGACGTATTDRCVLDAFGNAYMGFTSSTGEMGQSHDISKWLFCDEPGCGRE